LFCGREFALVRAEEFDPFPGFERGGNEADGVQSGAVTFPGEFEKADSGLETAIPNSRGSERIRLFQTGIAVAPISTPV